MSPSILFHGTLDFSMVILQFFSLLSAEKENESQLYNIGEDQKAQTIAAVLAIATTCIATQYYISEAHKQKIRLDKLQESMKNSCHE